MTVLLHNTLTRKVEPLSPLEPGKVRLYACGPTVYNYAHIGNLRTYIFEDILRRTLEHDGLIVNHVMNVTDVGHLESDADQGDDKMALAAKREARSPWDIARFYEKAFFEDLRLLNILPPTRICRATEHIKEMLDFIVDLEKKGFTYTVDGNVYFRIAKFKDYTALSKRNLEELKEGARVDVDPRKENPLDFVLWFSNSKYPNQIMKWDSPWGVGFPGWHIECSAMASQYLGERIDIHCGGIDHISIHHTNEIAQSEARFGHKWVNVWMHGEFLVLAKEKMAKSAGNFLTLSSLIDKGYSPLHFRYLCFGCRYCSQLFFSFEALDGAKNAFEALKNRVLSLKLNPEKPKNPEQTKALSHRFWQAMNNDLDTPIALAIVWEVLKSRDLSNSDKLQLMEEFDTVLGFGISKFTKPELESALLELVQAREQARAAQNWGLADQLRAQLLEKGVCLKDNKEGTDWYLTYKD